MVRELQDQPYLAIENEPAPKEEIACTHSFGQPVSKLRDLVEAVTEFASRTTEKLRQQ